MRSDAPREIVVSVGDPQGIGPEVAVAAAGALTQEDPELRVVLVGPPDLLAAAPGPEEPGAGVRLLAESPPQPLAEAAPSEAGGAAAFRWLRIATDRVAEAPERRALVTGPLSKEAVTRALGRPFDGHTGWLGEHLGAPDPLMLFVAGEVRVALATVHVPLRAVPDLLTPDLLQRRLDQLAGGLREWFGIEEPKIAVLALNPHAGEGGLLGTEERDVLIPAIEAHRRAKKLRLEGPFGADGFFGAGRHREHDAVLALFHDQGLVATKCLSFGQSVNMTVGLPLLRVSVDHGCAYDLAGRGRADARSMGAAMALAGDLLRRRGPRDG